MFKQECFIACFSYTRTSSSGRNGTWNGEQLIKAELVRDKSSSRVSCRIPTKSSVVPDYIDTCTYSDCCRYFLFHLLQSGLWVPVVAEWQIVWSHAFWKKNIGKFPPKYPIRRIYMTVVFVSFSFSVLMLIKSLDLPNRRLSP
jgi:hypothetical protein